MTVPPRRTSTSSRPPTRSDPPTTESGPQRSVEIEITFDVDAGTPLPDWSAVPGVARVAAPQVRELDARYFDTDELALGRAQYALRRRTGGPDAGWHLKGPRVGAARTETGWPLDVDGADPDAETVTAIPAAVASYVSTVVTGELRPVARVRNHRTVYLLCDESDAVLAEFVDDRVSAHDERTDTHRRWREWEVELGPGAPGDPEQFFTAVRAAVTAVGGRDAASESKLARALGF